MMSFILVRVNDSNVSFIRECICLASVFIHSYVFSLSITAASKDVEYRLAQSGDATCTGLENPDYGWSRVMTLKRFGQSERCDFPKWFKEPKHWHSLNGELSYNVHQKYVSLSPPYIHICVFISNDKWISMSWERESLLNNLKHFSNFLLFSLSFTHSLTPSTSGMMAQFTLRGRSPPNAWNREQFVNKSTSRQQMKQWW